MDKEELKRLKYRRQYLLTPQKIDCPFLHNTKQVNDKYWLYTHPDLVVTEFSLNNITLILLGDIFDYETPGKTNLDILEDLTDTDFDVFAEKTNKYCGRFVLIYINKENVYLLTDATATRKVYYCKSGSDLWFSSQSNLLALVTENKPTTIPSKLAYYRSGVYTYLSNANVGDSTRFDAISQLLPNHYLNSVQQSITRFYPNKKIPVLPVADVTEICAKMIKGYIEGIALRYNIMLPVTAGKDSRTLLAATKDIRNDVYYYINKENSLSLKSNDVKIPKLLLDKLGLDFHISELNTPVDEDFEKIYFENNEFASSSYLPHIYNYYLNYSNKVNLPGNFVASAFDMYGKTTRGISALKLAKFNWVKRYKFALDLYSKWLEETLPVSIKYRFNLWALFYWEERMANWGTQVQVDKDIAQEDINPFNSRLLVEYFFSVKPYYIDRPGFQLYMNIMKTLWPEVLVVPTNPSLLKTVSITLDNLGILDATRYLRSTFFHWDRPC